MTTKVTVDAHAGWPVLVRHLDPATGTNTTGYLDATVPPNEKRDFYVHSSLDVLIHEVQRDEPANGLSFGQRAVGLSFNPSGDPTVLLLKQLYAKIIDIAAVNRELEKSPEAKRLYSIAITEAQTAQMWAVKAATWRD